MPLKSTYMEDFPTLSYCCIQTCGMGRHRELRSHAPPPPQWRCTGCRSRSVRSCRCCCCCCCDIGAFRRACWLLGSVRSAAARMAKHGHQWANPFASNHAIPGNPTRVKADHETPPVTRLLVVQGMMLPSYSGWGAHVTAVHQLAPAAFQWPLSRQLPIQ